MAHHSDTQSHGVDHLKCGPAWYAWSVQVCFIGTTAYPGCASSTTASARLQAVFFSEAAWDYGGSLDVQPTTTFDIAYPYCIATNLTSGLPNGQCRGFGLTSPITNSTFTLALALATPRLLNQSSCFLLSGSNAFAPISEDAGNASVGAEGWAVGTVSEATCGGSLTPRVSGMTSRLCRSLVSNFSTPFPNDTVVSGQVSNEPRVA